MPDQILPSPARALDANGDPVVGAELFVYETGTTITVTVYTDSTYATPHPSPILSVSGGVFPQIYYAGARTLDIDVQGDGVSLPGYPVQGAVRAPSGQSGASRTTFSPVEGVSDTNVQDAIATLAGVQNDVSAKGTDLTTAATVADMLAVLELTSGDQAVATLGLGTWAAADSTEPLLKAGNLAGLADLPASRKNLGLDSFTSTAQVYPSAAGIVTVAHGLSETPTEFSAWVVCTDTDVGYSVDDVVALAPQSDGDGARNFGLSSDATNLLFISDGSFRITSKTSPHDSVAADPLKWDLFLRGRV